MIIKKISNYELFYNFNLVIFKYIYTHKNKISLIFSRKLTNIYKNNYSLVFSKFKCIYNFV